MDGYGSEGYESVKNRTIKELVTAAGRPDEWSEEAGSRGNCYGLLSLVFRDAPTHDFVEHLRTAPLADVLSRLGYDATQNFAGDLDAVIERLREEYTRLFIGPGPHVSLYASAHYPDEGQLWGDSTMRVKRFIEATGLSFNDNWDSIPDHIAIELELMRKLCEREAEAWLASNISDACLAVNLEKRFLEDHLSEWIPRFLEKVLAAEPNSFYRKMCELTKGFVCSESRHVVDMSTNFDVRSPSANEEKQQAAMVCNV